MSVTGHVDRARERVGDERAAVEAKLGAFDAFADRVAALSTEPGAATSGMAATTGPVTDGTSSTEDGCRAIRRAFAETVRPHSVADVDGGEPLLETVRSEFTESIAVALAPTTETALSPALREAVVSKTEERRAETEVLVRALDRERSQLDAAADTVDGITAWMTDADETPLSSLGFEPLRRRHDALADHRDRLETLASERQAFLRGATSRGSDAGVSHRSLVPYLYGEFPVDHPVLATVTRLDSVCRDCQRAVRAHLSRRA
ncbi:DUF7260 family protein [Halorarius halobius]|uniref:DUF7260 family protein n=1 Tax=Halorarius halobius TaxID=2962671 RepID=UPI0020CE3585|nr:hypothetical protein [Halorarius halobius]